jgi:hypothetical protein
MRSPSETRDPERVSPLPRIIPTVPTADLKNGYIGLRRAEFFLNVFLAMAKIIVLPYCPIHSHEKIRYFTTEKDEKSAQKTAYCPAFLTYYPVKSGKQEVRGILRAPSGSTPKGDAPGCMHILWGDSPGAGISPVRKTALCRIPALLTYEKNFQNQMPARSPTRTAHFFS